jgi:hypothetical protein
MPSSPEEDLNDKMMKEAILIIDSVAFLETQIDNVLGELQDSINNHDESDEKRIYEQINFLLKKTNDENLRMEEFMVRYKEKINEKKAILSHLKQKKQIHNGRISTNQTRQRSRSLVSR